MLRHTQKLIVGLLLSLVLLWGASAQAGILADRVAAFPNWHNKAPVQTAEGDLVYPAWLEGTWHVTSTLVDLAAPFAPQVVTPGFDSNRDYLNQPVRFDVRFVKQAPASRMATVLKSLRVRASKPEVVADRAFNGLNLARAYLGDRAVLAVKVDPNSPNRQITLLRDDRQLVSIVTARAIETPAPDQFITTELFQQVFRGASQPYLNQVETTTAYQLKSQTSDLDTPTIVADQITAVYLSPQDSNYFQVRESPVALYRYQLKFFSTNED